MKNRIKWIDCAKFLGILAIYLGHFGDVAGKSFVFVFQYHVALFFFLSGCMNTYDKEEKIITFIKKKFKSIMVPFFGFSLLSIIIYILLNNPEYNSILELLTIVCNGNIRNTFFAMGLWFLSCLFLMEIIFKIIKKFNNKLLIFLICLIMFVIAEGFIIPRPIIEPHWLYNLDSVFYYIIFYAIGYIIYPLIVKLFELDTRKKKISFYILGIISFFYAGLVFFEKDYLRSLLELIPLIRILSPIIRTFILIISNLILAKILENISLFTTIGKDTLYLCGNEFIIKSICSSLVELIGLRLTFNTPLHVYLYTMILLILSIKFLHPLERKFINSIKCI